MTGCIKAAEQVHFRWWWWRWNYGCWFVFSQNHIGLGLGCLNPSLKEEIRIVLVVAKGLNCGNNKSTIQKRTRRAVFPLRLATGAGAGGATTVVGAGFMTGTVATWGASPINLSRRSRSCTLESWGAVDAKAAVLLLPVDDKPVVVNCVSRVFSNSMMIEG